MERLYLEWKSNKDFVTFLKMTFSYSRECIPLMKDQAQGHFSRDFFCLNFVSFSDWKIFSGDKNAFNKGHLLQRQQQQLLRSRPLKGFFQDFSSLPLTALAPPLSSFESEIDPKMRLSCRFASLPTKNQGQKTRNPIKN